MIYVDIEDAGSERYLSYRCTTLQSVKKTLQRFLSELITNECENFSDSVDIIFLMEDIRFASSLKEIKDRLNDFHKICAGWGIYCTFKTSKKKLIL